MEQARNYLRILKRQHFWVLSGLIVLLSLVTWFLTVRSLASDRDKNQQAINGSYVNLSTLRNKPNHVNRDTQQNMTALINERRSEVRAAWDSKYKQQSGGEGGETILKWPEELGDVFIAAVTKDKFRPIEKLEPTPPGILDRNIDTDLREAYRDYVEEELPKLAQRIGAVWTAGGDEFGGPLARADGEEPRSYGGGIRSGRDTSTIVDWSPDDQTFIQTQHFDWSAGYGVPSSLQVLYAQEDLWVLTALVEIIRKTNGPATVRHSAAIKEIESIRIGKHAGGTTGKVQTVIAPDAVRTEDERSEMSTDVRPEPEGSTAEDGVIAQVDPANLRYVDKDYGPLPALTLRGAYSGNEADAYLRVAKRMPIRMRVRMDQRRINRLLLNCANSPLTVEVRQVRINPPDGGAGGFGGPSAGRLGRGGDEPLSFLGGRGGLSGSPFDLTTAQADDAFPNDVTVEIYGIIYIYNPVDEATLGGEDEGDNVRGTVAVLNN